MAILQSALKIVAGTTRATKTVCKQAIAPVAGLAVPNLQSSVMFALNQSQKAAASSLNASRSATKLVGKAGRKSLETCNTVHQVGKVVSPAVSSALEATSNVVGTATLTPLEEARNRAIMAGNKVIRAGASAGHSVDPNILKGG